MPASASLDPDVAAEIAALADDPVHLIGVRHHSPTLARVLPDLLAAADPDVLVLELPPQAQDWWQWMADPQTVAPVAFAVAGDTGVSFYPFADFSPELVALRWAHQHRVPVLCADLSPCAHRVDEPAPEPPTGEQHDNAPDEVGEDSLSQWLHQRVSGEQPDDAWDRLVEVPGIGASAERVRRSGLAFGWALRTGSVLDQRTAAREASMRNGLRMARADHGSAVVAVTGAWHSPALVEARLTDTIDHDRCLLGNWRPGRTAASLVPYQEQLLDSRSGYPSGIRDPRWQRVVHERGHDAGLIRQSCVELLTRLAVQIRAEGHPCGPAESTEAARLALDLAALRDLPAPGRRELLEAVTSVHAHGEVLGRGRVVARAAQRVLIGDHCGRLAPDTPRSGLVPAFEAELTRLGLPAPGEPGRELRLEPLRTDAEREVFLQRSRVAEIAYATQIPGAEDSGPAAVATRWQVGHHAGTTASLARAGLLGVTVEQAATGTLRRRRTDPDTLSDTQLLAGLADSARAALASEFSWWLENLQQAFAARAGVGELVQAMELLALVAEGALAGAGSLDHRRLNEVTAGLVDTAVAQVGGLAGSDRPDDARALAGLASLRQERLGVRLNHLLHDLADGAGSALMQGAAAAVLHRLGAEPATDRLAGRILGAATAASRTGLRRWLSGFVCAAPELTTTDIALLETLRTTIESMPAPWFVARLPALRGGFDPLPAAARERLLRAVGADRIAMAEVSAETRGRWAADDLAARERLRAWGLADLALRPEQRWALLLGRGRQHLDIGSRPLARSLDQLYGSGIGEGADTDALGPPGGGREPAYPAARVWGEELENQFGADSRDDIAAEALERGNPMGLDLLTSTEPRASVELLSQVLSLAGGMPESVLTRLRPMVRRMVAELSRVLADRLRPALTGLQGRRPSIRPSARLDAAATIRRNLKHSRLSADGVPQLVVATPVFAQPMARTADWHVIVLVDVSGSMEASTVFAALTAAILSGVDVLSVRFLAFSTSVVDLSDRVSDPLSLLLEIQIGGGTEIARALRVARAGITVPGRTMLVLITDFEESPSVAALVDEVTALCDSGVRLLGCAALNDSGSARYNASIAGQVAAAGMAVSAVSPTALARWVTDQVAR